MNSNTQSAPNRDQANLHALWTMRRIDKEYQLLRRQGRKTVFHPKAFIPVDEDHRVQMANATRSHLERWREVEDSRSDAEIAADREYIDSRLAVLGPDETLLDVEARVFGYQPTDEEVSEAQIAEIDGDIIENGAMVIPQVCLHEACESAEEEAEVQIAFCRQRGVPAVRCVVECGPHFCQIEVWHRPGDQAQQIQDITRPYFNPNLDAAEADYLQLNGMPAEEARELLKELHRATGALLIF